MDFYILLFLVIYRFFIILSISKLKNFSKLNNFYILSNDKMKEKYFKIVEIVVN